MPSLTLLFRVVSSVFLRALCAFAVKRLYNYNSAQTFSRRLNDTG